jgi:CrcB protein
VAAVGAGGFLGGLARYEVGLGWPTPAATFPWSTLAVNTAGALLLALLLVVAVELFPGVSLLRPTVGTGFCGAFTTFSSVTTAVDELGAHGRPILAGGYLVASLLTGLAATAIGLLLGRLLVARARPRPRQTA